MPDRDDLKEIYNRYHEEVLALEKLIIQGNCVFLIGAGCSRIANLPLMADLTKKVLESSKLSEKSKNILKEVSKQFKGARDSNIEDYLSDIIDYLSIIDRRQNRGIDDQSLRIGDQSVSCTDLRTALKEIKKGIAEAIQNPGNKTDIRVHRSFVKSIHRPTRPGKQKNTVIATYINLNYDTLLEDALALEKIPFYDGIDGGATGWWNFDKFNHKDVGTKVLKLHGSIDWTQVDNDPLPRRVASEKSYNVTNEQVMIWPASTKYRETQIDPFAQLLALARNALRSENQSEKVLVVLGYSFSDAHINSEIDRALKNSSGSLTIVVLTSFDGPCGDLKKWHNDASIKDQIRIYANKGFYHGNEEKSSQTDLLWWKFENFVKLIRGDL